MDQDILVARSTDGGQTWTGPVALDPNAATDAGVDVEPALATDGVGSWVVVWGSNDDLGGTIGADQDLLISRSTDGGLTWTPPAALSPTAATDAGNDGGIGANLAADGTGSWVAIWDSTDDLGGTIGMDFDVLVARSTDSGATWSAPAALNSTAATDIGDDCVMHMTTDRAGTWVAVWEVSDALGGTLGTDSDLLVSRSTDGGTTWSPAAAFNTTAAADSGSDGSPFVATDGLGSWVTAWQSTENVGGAIGIEGDILAARFALPDCDANGVGDGRDIALGTAPDCNATGIPDACELTDNDCDANGIPDECDPDTDGDALTDACDPCPVGGFPGASCELGLLRALTVCGDATLDRRGRRAVRKLRRVLRRNARRAERAIDRASDLASAGGGKRAKKRNRLVRRGERQLGVVARRLGKAIGRDRVPEECGTSVLEAVTAVRTLVAALRS